MDSKQSRREFLGLLAAGTLIAADACRGDARTASAVIDRDILKAASDELIPDGDGMPAASAIGAVEYIARLSTDVPAIGASVAAALQSLESSSRTRFGRGFTQIESTQRIDVLTDLEQKTPAAFAALRDAVYEAYYTNPRVWTLLGYEHSPTDRPGPHMTPFDPALVARVERMPRRYREITA
jgi:hypothetical protein